MVYCIALFCIVWSGSALYGSSGAVCVLFVMYVIALHCVIVCSIALQCVVLYGHVICCIVGSRTVPYWIVWYDIVWCRVVLLCMVVSCIVWCCTVLYSVVL